MRLKSFIKVFARIHILDHAAVDRRPLFVCLFIFFFFGDRFAFFILRDSVISGIEAFAYPRQNTLYNTV